jgi:hypothetical protein
VQYADAKLTNIHAELGLRTNKKLSFLASGDYYHWALDSISPWHKPSIELGFSARYSIQNKIIATAEVSFAGKRQAYDATGAEQHINLKPIIDASIGVEYRYTKILSAFARLDNIAAQQNQRWNYYPSYRFSALAGITYSF